MAPRLPIPRRRKNTSNSDGYSNPDSTVNVEVEAQKKALMELGLQVTGIFMLVVALGYWAISSFLGAGVTVPKSTDGILNSVTQPSNYSWSSESVRQATLGGNKVRQDAFRSVVVDTKLNKMQVVAAGVFPEKTLYLSDGKLTASVTDANQAEGKGWRLVTNACKKEPALSAKLLTMPSVEDIKKSNPELISSEGTVFGEQAWIIGFKPDETILKKAFWSEFFNAVTTNTPDERRWVLSKKERAAIESGNITLDYAYAWISLEKPRYMRQIEMRFYTDKQKTSGYRFLLKMFPDDGQPLKDTSFGTPDCNSSTVGGDAVTSGTTPTQSSGTTTTQTTP